MPVRRQGSNGARRRSTPRLPSSKLPQACSTPTRTRRTTETSLRSNKVIRALSSQRRQPTCIANNHMTAGNPASTTAGFFEDSNDFAILPAGHSRSNGNAGIFVLGQQMVYQPEEADSKRGLTMWGAWAYSGKQSVSPMPVFGGAGVSYEGLIPRRTNDVVSVGWLYGKTSDFIPNASAAKLLEVNYQWVSKRYLRIIPDFQYLWQPTGTNSSRRCRFWCVDQSYFLIGPHRVLRDNRSSSPTQ